MTEYRVLWVDDEYEEKGGGFIALADDFNIKIDAVKSLDEFKVKLNAGYEEYDGIIRVDEDDLQEFMDDICITKKFRKGMAYIDISNKYDDANPKKRLKDIWTERFKYLTIKKQADAVLNDKIDTTPEQKKLIEEYEKNLQDKGLEETIPLYIFKQYDNNVTMGGFCPVCHGMTHHGVPEGRITNCESRSMPKCKGWNENNRRQHEVHNLLHGKDEYFLAPGNVIRHED